MLKIGEFARICKVSTQALRYYDEKGLLKADYVDESSGYRYYKPEKIAVYERIVQLKELGFSLEEIKQILHSTNAENRKLYAKKRDELFLTLHKAKENAEKLGELCSLLEVPTLSLADFEKRTFTDDPPVHGVWELLGQKRDPLGEDKEIVPLPESPYQILYFLPGGKSYWQFFWTKGTLYRLSMPYRVFIPNEYTLFERAGQSYLQLRFIGDDCFDGSAEASLLIYRLKERGDFALPDTYAFKDDTDLPFLSDPLVEGFWRVCDFVSSPALFEEGKRCMSEAGLAQLSMKMMPDGQCVVSHRERDLVWQERLRYTKGLVLDEKQCFAKKYEIKHENGAEYLFVEHKSGDYHYGGKVYGYYVFKKEKI